ncbi:amino acid permease [Pandoraea horticolens]|uniref:Amino acid permease n=1 Tax=Pandoraea horticolens TaxID=2508298 RepID=A0A5E4UUN1_9BURK|nr:amino acid permease [Pandoraea horticolens]
MLAVTHVIWPVVSGVFLFFIALYSLPTFDWVTNTVGMGGIAIGVIPLMLNRKRSGAPVRCDLRRTSP